MVSLASVVLMRDPRVESFLEPCPALVPGKVEALTKLQKFGFLLLWVRR